MSDEQDKKLEEVAPGDLDFPLSTEQQIQELVNMADALRTMPSPLENDDISNEATQVSYIRNSAPTIVIPRKAIPDGQERMAEVKKVIHSKTFVPLDRGIRARLKPEKYESLDDYIARCAGKTSDQNTKEIAEAVAKISELSRALLKEVEENRVFHISEKKTLKQQLSDRINKAKTKFSFKKDELFWKFVKLAKKHLRVVRSYE